MEFVKKSGAEERREDEEPSVEAAKLSSVVQGSLGILPDSQDGAYTPDQTPRTRG